MKVLQKTTFIQKQDCLLVASKKAEHHFHICLVECIGNYEWSHTFSSKYGTYAMLDESLLLDLPGKTFLVYQINEHAKGGHYEYETQLMNLKGEVLNQFSGGQYSNFILEDKEYIWFLTTGKNRFSSKPNHDLELLRVSIKSGKIKQRTRLLYSELLHSSAPEILHVKLVEKQNEGILEINYRDKSSNNKKRLNLRQFT